MEEFLVPIEINNYTIGIFVSVLAVLVGLIFFLLTKRKKKSKAELPLATKEELKTEKPVEIPEAPKEWFSSFRIGLQRTRETFTNTLSGLFQNKNILDDQTLTQLHEVLFRADLGVSVADKLTNSLKSSLKSEENVNFEVITKKLANDCFDILKSVEASEKVPSQKPKVVLIVGVNGAGKTTTIGKLTQKAMKDGSKVMLVAADTFRAAAINQLEVWAQRAGADFIKHQEGSDPAAVAFDGVKAAKTRGADLVLIDTAGRLHNKTDLMHELAKIKRVISKEIPDAPHETWLVIDGTTGQNAVMQVKAFLEVSQLTGLIITKLDGTAKGGVVVGIAEQFKLPIRYIGIGEKAEDLKEFNAQEFANALFLGT